MCLSHSLSTSGVNQQAWNWKCEIVNYSHRDFHLLPLTCPKGTSRKKKFQCFTPTRYKNRKDTEHMFIRNVWHSIVVALQIIASLWSNKHHGATKERTCQKSPKEQSVVEVSVKWDYKKFIVLEKTMEPSMSKTYLGGIHQREQQAPFPCCTIMRHALRDTSISSTRPECNVTGCQRQSQLDVLHKLTYTTNNNRIRTNGWWRVGQESLIS